MTKCIWCEKDIVRREPVFSGTIITAQDYTSFGDTFVHLSCYDEAIKIIILKNKPSPVANIDGRTEQCPWCHGTGKIEKYPITLC